MTDTLREMLFMVNVGGLAASITARRPGLAFAFGIAVASGVIFLMGRP